VKKPTKAAMREFSALRSAEDFLCSAQGYLCHALKSVRAKGKKAAHHSMARVKECLSEASRNLREVK
jgi:hypothetical protein